MGSVVAFTLGSLLCAMASTILQLIIFRVVQGIGGGMLLPLGFMIMTREAGPGRLGRLMSILSIPMLLAPIAGPDPGRLAHRHLQLEVDLPDQPADRARHDRPARRSCSPEITRRASETFDVIGVLLLSPGLATFLFAVSSIPRCGTVADRRVLIPAAIGLALIAAFVVHALHRADHPLIDLRLFQNRVLTQANVTMLVFAVAFFGAGLLLPSYFQQVLHQTPMQAGVHLIPQGLGAMLTMRLTGPLVDRQGPGKIVLVGIALITAGLGTFAFGVARQAEYQPTLLVGAGDHGPGHGLHHDAALRCVGAGIGPAPDRPGHNADERQPSGGRLDGNRADVDDPDQPVQPKRKHHRGKQTRDAAAEGRHQRGAG